MDIDREKEGKCLTVTVPCYNSIIRKAIWNGVWNPF